MRYLLALSLLLCQLPLVADDVRATIYQAKDRDTNEFYDAGYRVEIIEYDGHEYLIVRMKHTDNFAIIHYPECKTCKNWPVDISQYQGRVDNLIYQSNYDIACVEVNKNGTYTVDQAGCVET